MEYHKVTAHNKPQTRDLLGGKNSEGGYLYSGEAAETEQKSLYIKFLGGGPSRVGGGRLLLLGFQVLSLGFLLCREELGPHAPGGARSQSLGPSECFVGGLATLIPQRVYTCNPNKLIDQAGLRSLSLVFSLRLECRFYGCPGKS